MMVLSIEMRQLLAESMHRGMDLAQLKPAKTSHQQPTLEKGSGNAIHGCPAWSIGKPWRTDALSP